MTVQEVFRALSGAKRRFKDNGETYEGFFHQQEWEAFDKALTILAKIDSCQTEGKEEPVT